MQRERQPPISPAELAKLRRKKNADAQAAFRKRRANYIASLEETVNNLEQIVQNMQANVHVAEEKFRLLQDESSRMRNFIARNGLWEQYHQQRPQSEPISPNTPTVYDPRGALQSTTPPNAGSQLSSSPGSTSGAYTLVDRPLLVSRFAMPTMNHGSDKSGDSLGDPNEMAASGMAMHSYGASSQQGMYGAPPGPPPQQEQWGQSPVDARSFPPPFSMGPPTMGNGGLDNGRGAYSGPRFGSEHIRGHTIDESASSSSEPRSTPPTVASDPASPFSPPGSGMVFPATPATPHGTMDHAAAFRTYFNHAASIRTSSDNVAMNVPSMHVIDDDDLQRRSSLPLDARGFGSERHGPNGMYAALPLSISISDRVVRDDDAGSEGTSPETSPRGTEEYSSTLAVLKNTAFGTVRKTRARSVKADESVQEMIATRALAGPPSRSGEKRKKHHHHDLDDDDFYD